MNRISSLRYLIRRARAGLVMLSLILAARAQATIVVLEEDFSEAINVMIEGGERRGLLDFSPWNDRLGTIRNVELQYSASVQGTFTLSASLPVSEGQIAAKNEVALTLRFDAGWGDLPAVHTATHTATSPLPFQIPGSIGIIGDLVQMPADSVTSQETAPPPTMLAYKVESKNLEKAAGVDLTGSWNMVVRGRYNRSYDTKTTNEYILDALILARNEGRARGETDNVIAQKAYSDIAGLRSTDAATSEQNVELRDAEYFVRGWRGAHAQITMTPFELANWYNEIGDRGGPYSTIAYNALKLLKGERIAGEGQLPATPPGGLEANLKGFFQGATRSLDSVIEDLQNGNSPPLPAPQPTLQPLLMDDLVIDGEEYQTATYYVPGSAPVPTAGLSGSLTAQEEPTGTILTLEVENKRLQSWAAYGNRFASMTLPAEYAALAELEVEFGELRLDITGETFFDFLTHDPEGVAAFRLLAGEGSVLPATSVIEFEFLESGEFMVGMVGGEVQPIPEPATAGLLGAGLCMALALRRRIGARQRLYR